MHGCSSSPSRRQRSNQKSVGCIVYLINDQYTMHAHWVNVKTWIDNVETWIDNVKTWIDNVKTWIDNVETWIDNVETWNL